MRLLVCFFLVIFPMLAHAEGPLLKPNDVIALVGGEDRVVASELGYLEAFVQAAMPDHRLKFRSLAWEGDTVFEQRRDLNYPPLEAQLEKMGATVVIAQFGQMESLGGAEKLAEFKAAYEKLITRLRGGGARRVILLAPTAWSDSKRPLLVPEEQRGSPLYIGAVGDLGEKLGCPVIPSLINDFLPASFAATRDGVHLIPEMHALEANGIVAELVDELPAVGHVSIDGKKKPSAEVERLRGSVIAKNRLWFHYSRPQNWAFLAGDRTNQPSSRDHVDRNKRWFPEELEKFVPLIEAKEKEIWELAAKLKH